MITYTEHTTPLADMWAVEHVILMSAIIITMITVTLRIVDDFRAVFISTRTHTHTHTHTHSIHDLSVIHEHYYHDSENMLM